MSNIAVHHSKQEWEANDRVNCRVDFFVRRHSILINHHLEVLGELIGLETCRWVELAGVYFFDLQIVNVGSTSTVVHLTAERLIHACACVELAHELISRQVCPNVTMN